MREEIANLVHPVLSAGLRLRERVLNNEDLDFKTEQSILFGKLQSDLEAKRLVEYGGDGSVDVRNIRASMSLAGRRPGEGFMGIRYALACWLDDIFIFGTPWSEEWEESKVETTLYGTNDRAWLFPEQAKLAEARPGSDALEVFYLCVMLGFRGQWRDEPDRLQTWISQTQARLSKSQGGEFPVPPEIEPQPNVPPLYGRDRLQRMILIGGIAFLILVPLLAFSVIRFIS